MFLAVFLFLLCAGAIYLACEYFVNAIEWFGRRLKVGDTATGSILAAFGTALPESAVTFTAVVFGSTPEQKAIGVGAAMGGPLVLATIAYAVVGLALLRSSRAREQNRFAVAVDQRALSRDQAWFLGIFVIKVGLGLMVFAYKPWCGLFFLAAYGVYLWRQLHEEHTNTEEELEPLKFRPGDRAPSFAWVALQTAAALAVIALASHTFVLQLEYLGTAFGMPADLVALLLSPVATELPETMNALIWVKQGKERLALANISGAMMIQATVPSALGIIFTPWLFDAPLIAAAIVTSIAIIALWAIFRRSAMDSRILASVGLLYGLFAGFVIWFYR